MGIFDKKTFNSTVFKTYAETIPSTKKNELIKSGVLARKSDWASLFPEQAGGNYAVVAITGRLEGTPVKYDGATDITDGSLDTFTKGVVAIGFAQSFTEKDFTESITGKDFMEEVAAQVVEYWDDFTQIQVLAILEGIFAMTSAIDDVFTAAHTTDISGGVGDAAKVSSTTANTAIQKASGDMKAQFTMALMHSAVATNLENLNLLEYLKYTDAQGVQRSLSIGTWNGKTVLVDDGMPYDSGTGKYTTYLLGKGAFEYEPLPVAVPYETERDAKKNGGQDSLITRERKVISPKGISFTKSVMASNSPAISELKLAANWALARNSDGTVGYPHKLIPIARIISKG